MTIIDDLLEAISAAERDGALVDWDHNVLSGFSGSKLVGALQRLTSLLVNKDSCYLEVGVFQGLTLLATATANRSISCYGIDNFSLFDKRGENLGIIQARTAALELDNTQIINTDFEEALIDLFRWTHGRKVGVYFIDGPHDYRSQLLCLEFALPYLAPNAVIIIDDCNYTHVRQANKDFLLMHPDFALAFEAYTRCHPQNMPHEEHELARRGWWDGVNIVVHDPSRYLERAYPPVSGPTLYANDHIVHSARSAELAVEAMYFANSLLRPWKSPIAFGKLLVRTIQRFSRLNQRFDIGNSDSSALPLLRFAALTTPIARARPAE